MELCPTDFWRQMGVIGVCYGYVIWVEKLVRETLFEGVEPCNFVFDVDNLGERNWRTFEDKAISEGQPVDCFIKSLFDWSRAQGFTSSIYVTQFIDSLSSESHSYTLVII